MSVGDIDRPVFPRSAVKALQAVPLVESGAADAFGFDDRHLALACSSHSGEEAHVALVEKMLEAVGLDEDALECGSHWPLDRQAMIALAAGGATPTQIHNNCSGKHAGFLATCRHLDLQHRGYVAADHPVQQMVREVLQDITGMPHTIDRCGHDGCSIPTCAVPLRAIAHGFSRAATGDGLANSRAAAVGRLISACMAEPFLVAGTRRDCSRLMQAAPGRVFVKVGSDGVFAGAVPELGFGIALKVDDGTKRAAASIVAKVLANLLKADDAISSRFREMAEMQLENRKGIRIGSVRPAGPIA